MKALITTFFLILFTSISFASSVLNLTINGGNSFIVNLNGRDYQTASTIRFSNLHAGRHTISVLQQNHNYSSTIFNGFVDINSGEELFATIRNGQLFVNDQPGFNQNLNSGFHSSVGMNRAVFSQLKRETAGAFDSKRRKLIVDYTLRYGISSFQAKQLLTQFSFDSGRLETAKQITNRVVDRENYWTVGETFSFRSNKQTFLDYLNSNVPAQTENCIPRPNPYGNNNYNYSPLGMNQNAFQILQRSIQDEGFDSNKKKQIIAVVKQGRISAQQMTTLLKEFSFDSNRLATAKSVIPYISDRENYWIAGETFSFSSNKNNFLKALE